MISWRKFIGQTRYPLRKGQIVMALERIENDPLNRWACVIKVGTNTTSISPIAENELAPMTLAEVAASNLEEYQGGLGWSHPQLKGE